MVEDKDAASKNIVTKRASLEDLDKLLNLDDTLTSTHSALHTQKHLDKIIEELNKILPRFPSPNVKITPDHIPDNSAGSDYVKQGKLNVLYYTGDDTWQKTPEKALRIITNPKEKTFDIKGNNNISKEQKKWLQDQITIHEIYFDFQSSQSKKTETKDKNSTSKSSNSSSTKSTKEKKPHWR